MEGLRLGRLEVSLKGDKEGMIGRECPSAKCNKYFKVLISEFKEFESQLFFCPYCGNTSHSKDFITKDQLEYAKSLVARQVIGEFSRELKKLETKPDPGAFISLGIEVKAPSLPVRAYVERELSRKVSCEKCCRVYRVYGTSFYCPYCGSREPLSVYQENVEMVKAFLNFKDTVRSDAEILHKVSQAGILEKLVERSLDMLVTAFETYCKSVYIELVKKKDLTVDMVYVQKKVKNVFQNLRRGNNLFVHDIGINFLQHLAEEELEFVLKSFQKRHVFLHNSGIIDAKYVKVTGEDRNLIGKKLTIRRDEIERLTNILDGIVTHIDAKKSEGI